jgi:hypothetical protein
MVWATLALLGVPVWLVLGALIGAMISRRRFKAQPGVVPVIFRAADDEKWPRRPAYGRYIHDVLIVNHGLAQIRTSVHVVEHVEVLDLGDAAFKHIDDPIAFTIRLDDGSDYELAVDRSDNPVPVPTEH